MRNMRNIYRAAGQKIHCTSYLVLRLPVWLSGEAADTSAVVAAGDDIASDDVESDASLDVDDASQVSESTTVSRWKHLKKLLLRLLL